MIKKLIYIVLLVLLIPVSAYSVKTFQNLRKLSPGVWSDGTKKYYFGETSSGYADLTANRILKTDSDKRLDSVSDLTAWVAGTAEEITISDDGDGTLTASLPRFSFSNNRMYLTNVDTARPIDRTSDVITSGTTVTNTTTETTLYTGTLGANDLKVGNVIKVRASGYLSTAIAADDVTLRVKIGNTTVATFAPDIGNITNYAWQIKMEFTVRSVGATGKIAYYGTASIQGETDQDDHSVQTIDTTSAENLTITAQWSDTSADDIIVIQQGYMEFKN